MAPRRRKPRRKPCPHCGSGDTGQILYGFHLPRPDDPLPDHVVLAGCCIPPNPPYRHCHACGRDYEYAFDRAEPAD